jgi:hypothetical protein
MEFAHLYNRNYTKSWYRGFYFSVSTLITSMFALVYLVVKQKLGTDTCISIFQLLYVGGVHSEEEFSAVLTPRNI